MRGIGGEEMISVRYLGWVLIFGVENHTLVDDLSRQMDGINSAKFHIESNSSVALSDVMDNRPEQAAP